MSKGFLKYYEVAAITVRSAWAYLWDQVVSTLYLAVIIFVFVQLWKTTYGAQGEMINGFTLPEMIWYLVGTEAIVWSFPRIHQVLEREVKNGDLALRLNKPYSFLAFHYTSFLGEALMKLAISMGVGGLTAYLLVGGFDFHWAALPMLLVLYLTTHALNFFYIGSIGLAAFWVEEVIGLYLLFDRLKWILGGMLIPIEVYPEAARRVVEYLPFRYMIGGPAHLFVKFTWTEAWSLLANQLVWMVVFGLICHGIYWLGVRRVDLNGG
jgi:ABC-2 type transport system permease protein